MSLERAVRQLGYAFGSDQARRIVEECLAEISLHTIETPDQQLRFSEALVRRGGFAEVIGRSLKVQALFWKARLDAGTVTKNLK